MNLDVNYYLHISSEAEEELQACIQELHNKPSTYAQIRSQGPGWAYIKLRKSPWDSIEEWVINSTCRYWNTRHALIAGYNHATKEYTLLRAQKCQHTYTRYPELPEILHCGS
jgi:hypothetical protein